MYTFQLTGKIKPYVRMTQKSKHVDPQAQEYLVSKDALQWQMRQQMQQNDWAATGRGIPLGTTLTVRPARHDSDLDNIVKAVLDAAQGIVYEDDRWIDYIRSSRGPSQGNEDTAYFPVFLLGEAGGHVLTPAPDTPPGHLRRYKKANEAFQAILEAVVGVARQPTEEEE